MRVEWLRDDTSPPAGAATPHSDALTESIRDEIARRGPITFAHFMKRALVDPQHGYYATAATRPSRAGDFVTAPELHPIFGRTLANQIDEMWRRLGAPPELVVREYGAGTGALIVALLDGLERIDSPLSASLRYDPVDFARQRALIADRLEQSGHASQMVRAADGHALANAVVIANEYIDALPVHRVIKLGDELREIHVDCRDGKFVEVAGPLTNNQLAAWFADAQVDLAENQRVEVNLAMVDWLRDLGKAMARGYVVVMDYGANARELYGPQRIGGTIRAFSGQRVSSDVLSDPGSRDITSSVDFDALERHARVSGFEIAGRTKLNEFLLAAGLDDVYQQARQEADNDWDAATTLRGAIGRLLDSNALGGYLVTILARDVPADPPLRGIQPRPVRG